MRTWCMAFVCLTALASAVVVEAGEIVIPAGVESILAQEAGQPVRQLALDGVEREQTRTLMRTWVSGSMDLGQAAKRESARFERTSYVQRSAADTLRLPAERLQIAPQQAPMSRRVQPRANLQLDRSSARAVQQSAPVHMVFREGPSRLKFHKVKEARATSALAEAEAKQLARGFLEGNHLLSETERDKVGRVYIQERRINEERGARRTPDDYLVQQDVVFEREVDGRPVINSKLVVGFQPDSRDILLLEHFNWTPLRQQGDDQSGDGAASPAPAITPSAGALRSRVEAKIRQVSGDSFARAVVTRAMPAWFQTKDSLLPVLVFEVNVTTPSEVGPLTEPYVEIINLAGSDDALYPGRPQPDNPTKAPGRTLMQRRPRALVVPRTSQ